MLVYLNEVEKGGETEFARLGFKVKPVKDAALVWWNVKKGEEGEKGEENEVCADEVVHAGLEVKKGEKWAMNVWIRKKFPGWDQCV